MTTTAAQTELNFAAKGTPGATTADNTRPRHTHPPPRRGQRRPVARTTQPEGAAVNTRTFDLGTVLTVTTGLLVSPRHMDGLYDVLNYMTGDNLMTHQLPRACREAAPEILRQHPDLADVAVPEEFDGEEHVYRWLAEQVARFGATRDLAPLAPEDHTHINPLAELRMVAPHLKVIGVDLG